MGRRQLKCFLKWEPNGSGMWVPSGSVMWNGVKNCNVERSESNSSTPGRKEPMYHLYSKKEVDNSSRSQTSLFVEEK